MLVLLSFTVSLVFFDRGEIFWSVPLAYPPLVYLVARVTWIGLRGRRPCVPAPDRLAGGCTAGGCDLPAGLPVAASTCRAPASVIDVGYAGVIGGDRILHGEAPYGHMPVAAGRPGVRVG